MQITTTTGELASVVKIAVRDALSPVQPSNTVKELLSATDAGKLLDVSSDTVKRWARQGHLKSHQFGRIVRFRRSELLELLKIAD